MPNPFRIPVLERRATRKMLRQRIDEYFAKIPWQTQTGKFGHLKGQFLFSSDSNSVLFKYFAGMSHAELRERWNAGSTVTSCNGLSGLMFSRLMGNRKRGINGFDFDIDKKCQRIAPLAWFSQADYPDHRPGYGDLVLMRSSLHVAVSLGSDRSSWEVIQSGQGGRRMNRDIIAKGKQTYPLERVVGWLSLAILWDYDSIRREHDQLKETWNENPWNGMLQMNRRRE